MTFTNDELILALISLVRATRPAMLSHDSDGFTVDFEALAERNDLDDDERLLLKMRTALEASQEGAPPTLSIELAITESRRLAAALAQIETMQPWPEDVLEMSRALRARLTSTP